MADPDPVLADVSEKLDRLLDVETEEHEGQQELLGLGRENNRLLGELVEIQRAREARDLAREEREAKLRELSEEARLKERTAWNQWARDRAGVLVPGIGAGFGALLLAVAEWVRHLWSSSPPSPPAAP